jgi:hypothetical protein
MTRRVHDMGGLNMGGIDPSDHDVAPWQKWINATFTTMILDPRHLIRLDELRRAMEDLKAEQYDRLEYFERQTHGFVDLLIEKGILSQAEIETRMAEIKTRAQ